MSSVRVWQRKCAKGAGARKSAQFSAGAGFLVGKRSDLRKLPLFRNPSSQKAPVHMRGAEAEHVQDALTMTATGLREKYRITYDSWKNMKSRRHTVGAVIDPDFERFADFLRIQGPRPSPSYTLDRLDNSNPAYGPGLCQWRDKAAQANNRRSTIYLNYQGECHSLSDWARRTGQKADTLRKRKANGWSDVEVITGHKSEDSFCWPGKPEERDRWERLFLRSGYRSRVQFVIDRAQMEMRRLSWGIDGHVTFPPDSQEYDRQMAEVAPQFELLRRIKATHDRFLPFLADEREHTRMKKQEAMRARSQIEARLYFDDPRIDEDLED